MPDEETTETTVAWTAIMAHSAVIAANRQEIGQVAEIAALPEEDIFHGVVFKHHALGKHLMAPAADIDRITDRAVYLSVDSTATEAYEEFHEMEIERLGVRGLFFWKHMGWKKTGE
ncbi:MAG TPA: hypothetical protein VIN56_04830 [Candidatus Dormibacteraeota bacterium]|jgi:hypothetical protein